MKRSNFILFNRYLIAFIVIIILVAESCDIDEISSIKDVKVQTKTRVVLPLAFGTIEIQTLLNYVGSDDSLFLLDDEGYFPLDPLMTEFEFPDTFAFNGSMLDILSHLELRIETENSIPMGVSVKLSFTDSVLSTVYGTPIQCNLLVPAEIDQTGKTINASNHVETVVLTEELIEDYRNATTLLANIRFFLPDTDLDTIYINQKDFLSLNVGIVVQAKTYETSKVQVNAKGHI